MLGDSADEKEGRRRTTTRNPYKESKIDVTAESKSTGQLLGDVFPR
jgi:hypothetical protein